MGNSLTNGVNTVLSKFTGADSDSTPREVLVVGYYNAGKTTLLHNMADKRPETTVPTIGFNINKAQMKGFNLTSWDLGGRSPMRPLFRHFYESMQGIIFVVDCSDRHEMQYVRDELSRLVTEELLVGLPILMVLNKMDLDTAMTTAEVVEALSLDSLFGGENKRSYHVVRTSAKMDISAMYDGMKWLRQEMDCNSHSTRAIKQQIKTNSNASKPILTAELSEKLWKQPVTTSSAQSQHMASLLSPVTAITVPASA